MNWSVHVPEQCLRRAGLTWQVREEQNALVEVKGHEAVPELAQDGQAHTEGESPIPEEQHVPEVKDLGQGEDVWGATGQVTSHDHLHTPTLVHSRVNMVRNHGIAYS